MSTYPKIHASHIEAPKREFTVEFLRPAYFNVMYFPEERIRRTVLAETVKGALKVGRYHYRHGKDFKVILPL